MIGCVLVGLLLLSTNAVIHGTLSRENHTSLGWPRLKVEAEAYGIAEWMRGALPSGSRVIASQPVALCLPLFRKPLFPVAVREIYLRQVRRRFGPAEVDRRLALLCMVSSVEELEPRLGPFARRMQIQAVEELQRVFRAALQNDGIAGVCLSCESPWVEMCRSELRANGFRAARDIARHEVWFASSTAEAARPF